MERDYISRVTFAQGTVRVVNKEGEHLLLRLDEHPELLSAYNLVADELRGFRTPEQIERDELTEIAISADPQSVVDIIPAWAESTYYRYGEHISYQGDIYRIVQPHTSQFDWLPPDVPALYTLANKSTIDPEDPDGGYPEWVQPTGAHDAYNTGDKVMFEGKAYESLMDGNAWSPVDHPQGWRIIE